MTRTKKPEATHPPVTSEVMETVHVPKEPIVHVTFEEPPKPAEPKLSAQTLGEMEEGRKTLARYRGTAE